MTSHTYQQLDADLQKIRSRILEMGGLVEQQLEDAFDALANADLELVDKVIDTDQKVNQIELELDEACIQLIARHNPIASDLRLIMSGMMLITDIERIGDEAKKIAKATKQILHSETSVVPKVELRHCARVVVDMLRRSLDGFARQDPAVSLEVVRQDKEVDAAFKGIMRQLITYLMEDARTISRSIDLLFIAKSIERVGDHCKNIAETVVYLVKGRDVRHEKLPGIEQALKED